MLRPDNCSSIAAYSFDCIHPKHRGTPFPYNARHALSRRECTRTKTIVWERLGSHRRSAGIEKTVLQREKSTVLSGIRSCEIAVGTGTVFRQYGRASCESASVTAGHSKRSGCRLNNLPSYMLREPCAWSRSNSLVESTSDEPLLFSHFRFDDMNNEHSSHQSPPEISVVCSQVLYLYTNHGRKFPLSGAPKVNISLHRITNCAEWQETRVGYGLRRLLLEFCH